MAATKETSARRPGMPSPSDQLPELDRRQRAVLRDVGREWGRVIDDPESWRDALPVDPTLEAYPASVKPSRFGRFVPVTALSDRGHSVETLPAERPDRRPAAEHAPPPAERGDHVGPVPSVTAR